MCVINHNKVKWGALQTLQSLFNRLLPSEQTGELSTVNLALRVNESCWHVGRCHYPTAHGGQRFTNRKWWYYTSFPRLWIPDRSAGTLLLPLQKCPLVHQLQQPQLLFFTRWRLKERTTDTSHNLPSAVITFLLNPEERYAFHSGFWVDFGKINILDEVRSSEKWFPSGWSSRLEEGVLLVDYLSWSEECVGKHGTGEPFSRPPRKRSILWE